MTTRRTPRSAGFTLIEMMIVVAVIGLLAAIAVTNFGSFRARSRQSEAKVNLQGIYVGEQAYYAANQTYAADFTLVAFTPERGNRYAYYLNSPPAAMQMRNVARTTSVAGMDSISVDTFRFPSLASAPTEFGTDGAITFSPNVGGVTIPAGSVTYLMTGSRGAFLARAFGLIGSSSVTTFDSWFISSSAATVTSPCLPSNGGRVSIGAPGSTYDQSACP